MNREAMLERIRQIDNEMASIQGSNTNSNQVDPPIQVSPATNSDAIIARIQAIDNEMAALQQQELLHKPLLAAQSFAKGALSIPDIAMAPNYGQYAMREIMPSASEIYEPSEMENPGGLTRTIHEEPERRPPSQVIQQILKDKLGLDLNSQEAVTMWDRIIKHGSEFAGGMAGANAIGAGAGLLGGGGLKSITPSLSTAKNLGIAGAMGAGSQVAQEAGVNPLVADIGAALAPVAYSGVKNAFKGKPKTGLAREEERVGRSLMKYIDKEGAEAMPNVLKALEEKPYLEGYTPTTAEQTKNTTLAQLERSTRGVIGGTKKSGELYGAARNKLDKMVTKPNLPLENLGREKLPTYELPPKNLPPETIEHTKEHFNKTTNRIAQKTKHAVEEGFSDKLLPEDAGAVIREDLHGGRLKDRGIRRATTKETYKKIKQSVSTKEPPTNSLAALEDELGTNDTDSGRARYNKLKKLILGEEGYKAQKKIDKLLKEYKDLPPEALDMIRKEHGKQLVGRTPAEYSNIKKELNILLRDAKDNEPVKRELTIIKKALKQDMSVFPEIAAADKDYHELSKPINAIEKHKVIGPILKRNPENTGFKEPYTGVIPEKFTKSREAARDFMEHTKNLPESREAIQKSINRDFVATVSDKYGNLTDMKLVEAWMNKIKSDHPGADIVYPHLKTKTMNVQNSRALFNNAKNEIIKDIDNYYAQAFEAVAQETPTKVVAKMLSGGNSIEKAERVAEVASLDKSGAATRGLQRSTTKVIVRKCSNSGQDTNGLRVLSHPAFEEYLTQHRKALEKIYTPDQMKVLDMVEKQLSAKQFVESVETPKGSPTAANLANMTILESMNSGIVGDVKEIGSAVLSVHPTTAAGWNAFKRVFGKVKGVITRINEQKTAEVLNDILFKPDYAKLIFTKIKDAENMTQANWDKVIQDAFSPAKNQALYIASQHINKNKDEK